MNTEPDVPRKMTKIKHDHEADLECRLETLMKHVNDVVDAGESEDEVAPAVIDLTNAQRERRGLRNRTHTDYPVPVVWPALETATGVMVNDTFKISDRVTVCRITHSSGVLLLSYASLNM